MHLSEDRLACIVEAVIDQYADRIRLSCFQNLDTGANRFNLLQRSIATLKQSLASSGYYPLASRTATIFASVDNDREERKADRFSTACRQRDEHVLSM